MNIAEVIDTQPYSLNKNEKEKLFSLLLTALSQHHYVNCEPYRKMMSSVGYDFEKKYLHSDLPFLPVQLFKTNELYSTAKEKIVKTLSSSGTSGQKKTMVFLDKENAANQTKVLAKIVSSFIGPKRVPMIIIESESVINNRNNLSASAVSILGFSLFGSKKIYALNERMELNVEQLQTFIEQHKGERIFIFGLTFMVYHYFCKELERLGIKLDLADAILIHGGGWKKLERESVSAKEFKEKLNDVCSVKNVHDYYGMVEQTGSIYLECELGHLHASVFSDIIIRRAQDFSIANVGEEGIIQVLSLLPTSYPGHSLLTEDKGVLLGEDNCACGRLGKYFKMTGRLKHAEIRGCSDTYEESIK
ncbi:MAG TPA: acyl-protein synthetase [Bacteroidia bacterium]|jgi:phenylacetate-coenzyme A ligase PaaK-like adenylate-forming protein|nr:acyl-protein synthetase [Bacteroidia bacterium]